MNAQAKIEEEIVPVPDPAEIQAAIDKSNGNEASTESEPKSEEDVWGDFAQELEAEEYEDSYELETDEVEIKPTEPVAPEPEAEVEPVTTPAEEPNVEEEITPPTEVETFQPETPPIEQPVVQTPQQPMLSQEEIIQRKKEQRATVVENLAKHYSFSDEDSTTLLTDPGAIMPKLRAEMFMDIYDATVGAITQAIPNIVQNMNVETTARQEAENGFYNANPLLNKAKHAKTVNRLAQAYVNAVPDATPEQMVKEVGVQAMFLLGIDPTKGTKAAPSAPTPPVQQPYTPAGAGHMNAPAKAVETNEWAQIAEDLLEDD